MATGKVTLNTDSLAYNYLAVLSVVAPQVEVGAVVKSNAYGIGVDLVAPVLLQQQCKTFFVMTLDEGIELRRVIQRNKNKIPPPPPGKQSKAIRIVTLGGVDLLRAADYVAHKITPAVASMAQLNAIRHAAIAMADGAESNDSSSDDGVTTSRRNCHRHPIFLQLNTGMNRYGLDRSEIEKLADDYEQSFEGLDLVCVMSHLAAADELNGLMNAKAQQMEFEKLSATLEMAHLRAGHDTVFQRSLANSNAIFRGDPSFHYDLVRPGLALYGSDPRPKFCRETSTRGPSQAAVKVELPITQIRSNLPEDATVGYNPTQTVATAGTNTIAVVAGGYADGLPSTLAAAKAENFNLVWCAPSTGRVHRVPYAAERGSMDSIIVDLSHIPTSEMPKEGDYLELFGHHQPIDTLATRLRPQEIMVRMMSQRLQRVTTGSLERMDSAETNDKKITFLSSPPPRITSRASTYIYSMLEFLDAQFGLLGIRYWGEGGTLLGLVRDGGIMRHDDDADLQIHPDDTRRLVDSLPALRNAIASWSEATGVTAHLRESTFGYKLIMEPREATDAWQLWFDTLGGKWACGYAIVDLFLTRFEGEGATQTVVYQDELITEMIRKRGNGDMLASRLGDIPKHPFGPIDLCAPVQAKEAALDVFGPNCMSTIEGKDGQCAAHVSCAIDLTSEDLALLDELRRSAKHLTPPSSNSNMTQKTHHTTTLMNQQQTASCVLFPENVPSSSAAMDGKMAAMLVSQPVRPSIGVHTGLQ